MSVKIFIIGQCTLHWGRMEFGNIGNYYIIEPFVRELHRVFPNAEIRTTFQMSDEFCEREKISVVPMDLYYSWSDDDLRNCLYELGIAEVYNNTGVLCSKTPYIEEVLNSDLIIDFSGDIWGDNADFLGKDRFLIGAYKDKIAKLLKKPVVMIAGSPGPFDNESNLRIAKDVFPLFDIVTNRERLSRGVLESYGLTNSNMHDYACPAFLFEPKKQEEMKSFYESHDMLNDKPKIGLILCGWNMKEAPFSKWPRNDEEYSNFAVLVERILSDTDADLYLMSHSNGFEKDPSFRLIQGRDYPIMKQLFDISKKKNDSARLKLISDILLPDETKAVIGSFDMLVSGRVHGAVAGISQAIPTVIIDYGQPPEAHKLRGFADVAGVSDYIADPNDIDDMIDKVSVCWKERIRIKGDLELKMIEVKKLVRKNFEILTQVVE